MRIHKPKRRRSKTSSKLISTLGFATYGDYLSSDLWKTIRFCVFYRDRWRCRGCGGKAKEVHHYDYKESIMRGKQLECVFSLCKKCHRTIHYGNDGRKRNHQLMQSNTLTTVFKLSKKQQTLPVVSSAFSQERQRSILAQRILDTLIANL